MRLDDEMTAYQIARTLDRKRLFHQSSNHPEIPNSFGVDLQRQRLLPADTRSQQRKATGLGKGAS